MLQTQIGASAPQALLFSRLASVLGGIGDSLRYHYRLLIGIVIAALVLGLLSLHFANPLYTATAVVGPSNGTLNESTSVLESALGGIRRGGAASLARGVLGSNPTFNQFNKILQSNRLAAKLASDQDVLRTIFDTRYDWEQRRWKPRSGIGLVTGAIKGFINLPVKSVPDADDVQKYISTNVTIDAPLTSDFITVTLKARDPKTAEWLLMKILYDADTLIRDDRRRDVAARIAYLESVLPTVSQSDERQALIFILNDQRQSMMTVAADQRYASNLVDPPHASRIPTSPTLIGTLSIAVVIGIGLWFLIVRYKRDGFEFIAQLANRSPRG